MNKVTKGNRYEKGLSAVQVAISMRSVHDALLQGEMGIIDFLKYAASLAVDGVELDGTYLESADISCTAIAETLSEKGLKASCYDIHHRMEPLKPKERENVLKQIKAEIAVAQCLGAEYVQIVGEVFDPSVSAQDVEALILEYVEMILSALDGSDIKLAIENPESATFQSHHMVELLKKIDNPQVKVGFNMANSLIAGEDPELALERLQDYIAHVRAVDVRLAHHDEEPQTGSYVGCVIGLGLVPLERLFQVLKGKGYEGWIALEFTGLEESHFGTEASLKNLRQALAHLQSGVMHPNESIDIL